MVAGTIKRYDGTRFITGDEIDREFLGRYVLVSLQGLTSPWDGGYLVAVAEDAPGAWGMLDDIGIHEFAANSMIHYGCAERGEIHVELLD